MRYLSLLLLSVLFGIGLVVSGMAQPAKVVGFLDIFGAWDPSLAFVMDSALFVTHFGFKLVLNKPSPILSEGFQLPGAKHIDARLVVGASFFGIGWGLSGFCPGPALVALGSGHSEVITFVGSMFVGFFIKDMLDLVMTPSPA